jgi:hypothetical protein
MYHCQGCRASGFEDCSLFFVAFLLRLMSFSLVGTPFQLRGRGMAQAVVGRLHAGKKVCKVSSSLPSGSLLTSQSELACSGQESLKQKIEHNRKARRDRSA